MVTNNNKEKYYAVLDYDGFVCKSFYANKEDPMNIEAAKVILRDLTAAAIEKTANFFETSKNNVTVLPIMSGHSWKKDIYPSYKRSRKRNEYLGIYRDEIKKDKNVIIVPQLEADEVIVAISDFLEDNKGKFIVFSDDKDLKYYSTLYCKINILEEVQIQDPILNWASQLEQMIIGDKEDNITGIPKVGEKTAPKLLHFYGYNIDGVIKSYIEKNIDIDNCLRDLLLVIPMSKTYLEDQATSAKLASDILELKKTDDLTVFKAMESQILYLSKKVKEVYDSNVQ